MLGLFNATVKPGIELVLNLAHGREACAWADVVITGEGSIDSQTPYGKVPSGIAKLAQSQGKPTIAIGGTVTRDPHTVEALNNRNIRHCARASRSYNVDRQHGTQCRNHLCRNRQHIAHHRSYFTLRISMMNTAPSSTATTAIGNSAA